MKSRRFEVGTLACTLAWLAMFFCSAASAKLFIVRETEDSTRVTSLRGAIIAANHLGGRNTILLAPRSGNGDHFRRSFRLTIQGPDENEARTGDLNVTRGYLTIIVVSPEVTIDATGLGDRVFQVHSNARLTLLNLRITGGSAPPAEDFGPGANGGGIFNSGELTLRNCVLAKNSSGAPGVTAFSLSGWLPSGSGGAIYNDGYASLTRTIISSNSTPDGGTSDQFGQGVGTGAGAGVFNSGQMLMDRCAVIGNFCGTAGPGGQISVGIVYYGAVGPGGTGGCGGGILNQGEMTLRFSTLSENVSGMGGSGGSGIHGAHGGTGGDGAAICNSGTLAINTCTISDNVCGNAGQGGEGDTGGNGGTGGSGGGIWNEGPAASLEMTSCTVVSNRAGLGGDAGNGTPTIFSPLPPASGGNGGSGGGIYNGVTGTNATCKNTIIALNILGDGGSPGTNTYRGLNNPTNEVGNPGAVGSGPDISGDFSSGGFNLIGVGDDSSGLINGTSADQIGSAAGPIDPLIGPLQMNCGRTPTHALLPGSPAINQGNSFGIHTDQRGYSRPYKYPGVPNASGGDGADIGAFELDSR
ncbi:MAG: hypothetical protein C5B50_01985 [Verrucomicrobia bacterium]|nr:MAG: hypothetical protein C5B50_01985 [Verrucomicrobiota bacterium]